jgi:hypothetical protein
VTFTLDSGPATHGYVDVYAVLVKPTVSTKMLDERGVRNTQTRSGVVETFGRIGSSWRTKDLGERPFTIKDHGSKQLGNLDGMRLVVFVQTKLIGPVLGSTSCVLGGNITATGDTEPASFPATPCPTSVD